MTTFHLVGMSLWPLCVSLGMLGLTIGMVFWFYYKLFFIASLSSLFIISTSILWWRDVSRESVGMHTSNVVKGLKIGMLLFIMSEIMFFFSFFWAFFSGSGAPTIEVGSVWPPIGVEAINPFHMPLLNTMTLLISGVTLTWSHNCFFSKNMKSATYGLSISIVLGIYFTILQVLEFTETSFSMNDSIFGSTFFVTTGFHGVHVIVGTIFLSVCFIRMNLQHFSSTHHLGFEMAAWYWHFVDVVWLFLFIFFYWWAK